MAHTRTRIAAVGVGKALSYSPCVGVVGMRQVGKSTLIKQFAKRYFSFDKTDFYNLFEQNPDTILESPGSPLGLDEVQKYPPAFDALKFSIDQLKKPGRFIITGSVRFASRRQIRESLTGRIVTIEMHPLTLSECHDQKPSQFLSQIQSLDVGGLASLQKKTWCSEPQVAHYMISGGLPGICFKRNVAIRNSLYDNHLDALLSRDITLVRNIKLPVNQLKIMLREIARRQGLPINIAELARVVGVSFPTAKIIVQAFEALFLVRPFGSRCYIEDAGLAHYLCKDESQFERLWMTRCLYYELRVQWEHQLKHICDFEPHETRGGIFVPFYLRFHQGAPVALLVDDGALPSNKSLKSIAWLKRKTPRLKGIVLCRTPKPFVTTTGVICLPWTWVF